MFLHSLQIPEHYVVTLLIYFIILSFQMSKLLFILIMPAVCWRVHWFSPSFLLIWPCPISYRLSDHLCFYVQFAQFIYTVTMFLDQYMSLFIQLIYFLLGFYFQLRPKKKLSRWWNLAVQRVFLGSIASD